MPSPKTWFHPLCWKALITSWLFGCPSLKQNSACSAPLCKFYISSKSHLIFEDNFDFSGKKKAFYYTLILFGFEAPQGSLSSLREMRRESHVDFGNILCMQWWWVWFMGPRHSCHQVHWLPAQGHRSQKCPNTWNCWSLDAIHGQTHICCTKSPTDITGRQKGKVESNQFWCVLSNFINMWRSLVFQNTSLFHIWGLCVNRNRIVHCWCNSRVE